ncbi:hypothetical protein [Bradyrhizobium sp. dw_78]|uniref:hypothetical protein n=1 Tax=Bradyrhizobium sp. dw_78 TaxID=2719793 RepID=UPI00201C2E58|nr:hypothetical protein [Bradyrhizobium sp. dw_78]
MAGKRILIPGAEATAIRGDIRGGAELGAMIDMVWREALLDIPVNNAAAHVPAPRTCCGGPMRNGKTARGARERLWAEIDGPALP